MSNRTAGKWFICKGLQAIFECKDVNNLPSPQQLIDTTVNFCNDCLLANNRKIFWEGIGPTYLLLYF